MEKEKAKLPSPTQSSQRAAHPAAARLKAVHQARIDAEQAPIRAQKAARFAQIKAALEAHAGVDVIAACDVRWHPMHDDALRLSHPQHTPVIVRLDDKANLTFHIRHRIGFTQCESLAEALVTGGPIQPAVGPSTGSGQGTPVSGTSFSI